MATAVLDPPRRSRRRPCPSTVGLCLALLFLLGSAPSLRSQSLDPTGISEPTSFEALTDLTIKTWRGEHGLANTTIIDLAQSDDGYLWIATAGGVFRFDGQRFERFYRGNVAGFLSNRARTLAITTGGEVWVGFQHGGAHRYVDGEWFHLTVENGLDHNNVEHLVPLDDGLLIRTSQSVRFWDGESLRRLDARKQCPEGNVQAIGTSAVGGVWWLAAGDSYIYRGGRCERTSEVSRTGAEQDGESAWQVRVSHDGSLRLQPVSKAQRQLLTELVSTEVPMNDRTVSSIFEDSAGRLWLGFNGRGLARFDGERLEWLTPEDGLADDRVWSLLKGREGAIWVGTYDGLQRLQSGKIRALTETSTALPFTLAVFEDHAGTVWLGAEKGAFRYRDGRLQPVTLRVPDRFRGEDGVAVRSFFELDDGQLWAGSDAGLLRLEADRWVRVGEDFGLSVRAFAPDVRPDSRRFWIGTNRGVWQVEGEKAVQIALEDLTVYSMHRDRQGRLLVGTSDGLFVLSEEGGEPPTRYPESGHSIYVRAIHEDDQGEIWLGTLAHGLLRLKGRDLVEIGTAQGLFDDNVWHILDDRRGSFWMCSDLGIFATEKEGLNRLVNGELERIETRVYGLEDGLRDLECNGGGQPSAFRGRNGRLWFPTAAGPAIVDVVDLGEGPLPFAVRLAEVSIDGVAKPHSEGGLEVPRTARELQIRFTAPSLRDAGKLRFRYRLEGYDPDWRAITRERTAVYGRLPPGEYRFVVQARGADKIWAEKRATLDLRVPTPPWRTGLAFSFYVLALIAGVLGIVRAQQKKIVQEREMVDKQLKVLQGFLPICSRCKSIREEDGQWTELEAYIDQNSEAVFSHGICPSCMEEAYPEYSP